LRATPQRVTRGAGAILVVLLAFATGRAAQAQAPLPAQEQAVTLSFDDGYDPRTQPEAAAWNAALLDALAFAEVRAIFYPAGNRVDSPAGLALVKAWSEAGHAIGNHTYAHRNLASKTTSVDAYTADIAREEKLVGALPGFTKRIRFPFLKEGDTVEKRDRVRDWLATHGYRSGAVTIDTSDWYYDQRFVAWKKKHPRDDPEPFRRAYLAHLSSRIAYYDGLSRQLYHRSVKHVLLLHTNAINAAFLPDILDMLRANGWTVVRPGEAYDDPVYKLRPDVLPAGESLLWSLAKAAKVRDLRYPGEDDRYEKPLLDALGL
jgi:peptidoglycan-N-acetylglucosamine deacetylase